MKPYCSRQTALLAVFLCLLFLYSCGDKPGNTGRIIETLGHETLHCFFGEWHDPQGRHPSRIETAGQVVETMQITVRFATEAELQRLYREAANLHTAPDRNIDKVDGFNVRNPNDNTCTVYILET